MNFWLSKDNFDRMVSMWHAADRVLTLVFLGDRHQLPGVEPTRPRESKQWKKPVCYHVELRDSWC